MSMTFLVEISCDAESCKNMLRTWNWAALGAISQLRAERRRNDWLTVKSPGKPTEHYCAAHKAAREKVWNASIIRADRADAWVKEKAAT